MLPQLLESYIYRPKVLKIFISTHPSMSGYHLQETVTVNPLLKTETFPCFPAFFSVSRPPHPKLSIILPAGMERFFSFWNKYESKMGFTQFFQIFRWWENPPQICQSGNLTGQTISFGRWILYLGGIDWGGAVSLDVILFQYTDTRPLYIQYWLGVNVANIHHILIFKSSDSILWVFCCSAIDLGLL